MDLYTAGIILIAISMIIMIVSVGLNSAFSREKKIYSIILFCIVGLCALAECAGTKFKEGTPELKNLHILVKWFELSFAPAIGFMPGLIFKKTGKRFGIIEWIVIGVLSVHIILETISSFTGFIYKVDENNVYTHGSAYCIYLIVYTICILYFIYASIVAFRHRSVKYIVPFYLVFVFAFAGIIIQFVSNLKISYLTIAISSILIFKFYGDVLANTDGLTDLLNRLEFDNTIKNLSKDATIIYFDVNKFKTINDTYGHIYGDTCLKDVAQCLRKAYGKYGKIYRYGGDEFCVILQKRTEKLNEMNSNFSKYVKEIIDKDSHFPGVSFGFATFKPHVDEFIDVLSKADQNMYEQKREEENL